MEMTSKDNVQISDIRSPEFLKGLRIVGFIEGCSTLILFFVAMPLKYLKGMPQAVTLVGSLHGGLFVLLVALALLAVRKVPISQKLSFTVIVAAIFPFGPFIVDRKLKALS